ncbi:MAG: acyl-CoA dehydrogenase [Actinomycetes bacterium]
MTATETRADHTTLPTPGATAVDPGALRRVLDGRWAGVRDSARELAALPLFHSTRDLDTEAHRSRVSEQSRELAGTGHPRRGFPAAYGGEGDVGGSVTAFEMLAYGDLSLLVKAGVQWGLCGGAVLHLGTKEHQDRYLPGILSYDLPGCFAMTETGHGSDVQSVGTTATYDRVAEEFVVTTPGPAARKDYIGNAARDGRIAVVFAQLVTDAGSHGVHALMVPIRDEDGRPCDGVEIEDNGQKAGLNGVDNGRLTFHDVRVPRTALLNRYGDVAADGTYSSPIENENRRFFTMLGTLIQGRISVAGGGGSAAKTALNIAVRYAERRRQFKAPGRDEEIVLLDYLAHQRRLLPRLATSYALHFAQGQLVADLHDVFTGAGDDAARRELETRAAGVKAIATWHATATIQECREACGGAGYLAENRLPQLKADSDVFTTFEGDNTVLLQLVAKGLLTDYRDHFGDLDALATVRFVVGQVAASALERTAAGNLLTRVRAGRDDDASLFDRGYQRAMFAWREKHVIDGLARRMRKASGADADLFDVFNAAQDHLLRAARNHVDGVVLEAFVAAIDECDDPAVKALLNRVCDLHALANIEADRAWFLEHGRLTARRAKALTAAVNELCRELRPHAGLLVDGFGIPEEAVSVPLLDNA